MQVAILAEGCPHTKESFLGNTVKAAFESAGAEVELKLAHFPYDVGLSPFDPNRIRDAIGNAETIVDLSGLPEIGLSRRAYGWHQVARTENLITAASASKYAKQLLYLSTCDVTLCAGPRVQWNEDRDIPGRPVSDFADLKRDAEALVVTTTQPIRTIAFRTGAIWGEDDDVWLAHLAYEAQFGKVETYGDPHASYSLTHAKNLAAALVRSASCEQHSGQSFHIVDHELFSFLDIAERLVPLISLEDGAFVRNRKWRAKKAAVQKAQRERRAESLRRLWEHSFDSRRAAIALGYKQVIGFEEGMKEIEENLRSRDSKKELSKRWQSWIELIPAIESQIESIPQTT